MSNVNGRKPVTLDFSDMSGGKNNARPQNAINDGQVAECMNAVIEQRGFTRAPGYLGLKSTASLPSFCRYFNFYRKADNSELALAVSNSKVSSVSTVDGSVADLYTLAGDSESFGFNALGKHFIANGTDFIKVESTGSAYMVGITAPTGASARAYGAGTLTAGTYHIYVSYARKVSGLIALYSYPMDLGNVTVSGSQAIEITCPNSPDPQVTDKIVWAIEPSGSVSYQYYDHPNNTATVFSVTNSAGKSILLIMDVEAVANYPIPLFTGIYYFDGRILGWKGNKLYWSIPAGANDNDLERFPQENFRAMPYTILSCFELSGVFFMNTEGGVYRLPNGDLSEAADYLGSSLYFVHHRSHKEFKGFIWGVTNDGVRYFDGETFSQDLSKDIKPDIDIIIAGMADNYYPCIEIHRRSGKRTELHLSYRDTNISVNCNNSHLVLNLDSIVINDETDYKIAWESWEGGFNYTAISKNGTFYAVQNCDGLGASVIKENGKADQFVYDKVGTFLTEVTPKKIRVVTKAAISNIMYMGLFDRAFFVSRMEEDAIVSLGILDNDGFLSGSTLLKSGGVPLLLPFVFPAVLPAMNPSNQAVNFPMKAGKLVYLTFEQTCDDDKFNIFEMVLHGTLEGNNQS
jgi:hypothetical protein